MKAQTRLPLLIAAGILLFFLRLGGTSVYQVAEARNAECAREMYENGNPVVPVFNGELRTDKPALEYFAMMTAFAAGGISEGSARFFSALCGLLVVIFTFLLARKYAGERAAWWSALTLLASVHTIVQFRLATPDPYLILCHTLSLYCFIEGWLSRRRSWWIGLYFFLGLAMLAKGPVGIALPGLTIFLFLLFKKQFSWKVIKRLQPWWGLLLILVVAAPWYLLVHRKTGGAWTKGFFFEHNIGRFSDPTGGHGGIFLLTLLFVLLGMLPFSVFIFRILRHSWKLRKENDLLLFALIALCCVVGFYMLSRTKLINYTTPCYPFLALLSGHYLSKITAPGELRRKLLPELIILLVFSLAIPVGIYFWTRSLPELSAFGWIALCFLCFPAGVLLALYRYRRGDTGKSLTAVAGGYMLNTLLLFAWPYPLLDAQTPMRKAEALLQDGARPVMVYKSFNNAFLFYTRYPVTVTDETDSIRSFIRQHPDGLIISDTGHGAPLDSLPELQLIRKDHEIFNSHTAVIYGGKEKY
ncbi:glycosyltransferase family 39 protein [Compostibacter hankyongensis]|uniref:Glycosyltransferase family 39 protein n=1 Tax=Compostibacter hankyongensis TaxID=1007089 RepID=A0ABP8FPU9_9BACT